MRYVICLSLIFAVIYPNASWATTTDAFIGNFHKGNLRLTIIDIEGGELVGTLENGSSDVSGTLVFGAAKKLILRRNSITGETGTCIIRIKFSDNFNRAIISEDKDKNYTCGQFHGATNNFEGTVVRTQ